MTTSPTPLEAELASRLLSRRRLLAFTQRVNPQYKAGWVHEDICRRLEKFSDDVAKGLSPRLMLLMPPRSGKSELASRMFPAWHLGRNPNHEIIACSYNVSLAMSFSKKVKEVLEDPVFHPVFEIRLNPNNQSAEEWSLDGTRGGYVAAGVGGGITGKGAHLLTIDDPLKNAEEADSADTREKLWDWYGSTAYTRLAPGGGVLVVQCMVGGTQVLLPDGTEKRLDALRVGDEIATFEQGRLSKSRVNGLRSNGVDEVFKITTVSGKEVRANGRHPFLVDIGGELKWVRTRKLSTAHKIVTLKGSGANGEALPVQRTDVTKGPYAEDIAPTTTLNRSEPTATDPLVSTQNHIEINTLSTDTVSVSQITTPCMKHREVSVQSAHGRHQKTNHCPTTGKVSSPSITATIQGRSEVCSVTDATPESDILELSQWHKPQLGTSDFILEEIISVVRDGAEEVFDLQVEKTENFIASGLVSHNTWWHDDDLAGRLQNAMSDPDADQFVVVKYPAIAEFDEYLDEDTDLIVSEEPENGRLLRLKGEALHPERYDIQKLNQIKKTISPRFWSALYQQNPVPDDGAYFLKENFKRAPLPNPKNCNVFIAWDFAISEKKTNDYTVGTVGLQDDDDVLHVAEIVRFRSADAMFIVDAILNLSKKWYNSGMQLGFEDGQIYRAIEALLKKRMLERQFYPSVQVLKPISDKMARARPLQGRMQQGMVSFNNDADWYETARLEMLRFPAGAHDDIVDSVSWMTQMAIGRQAPKKPKAAQAPSWRDRFKQNGRGSFMAA